MSRSPALIFTASLALILSASFAEAKGPKGCPPGLAKKSPECVPPGLAKKGVTAEEWQARGDEDGDYDYEDAEILTNGDVVRIDGKDYIVIETADGPVLRRGGEFYRLPDDDLSNYGRVGDALVKVNRTSRQIIELIKITDLILS